MTKRCDTPTGNKFIRYDKTLEKIGIGGHVTFG